MNVNLPNALLRTFVAIVDHGSIASASKKIFLTQSALSIQLKKLEFYVKQPLFNRDGKKLILNEYGRILYDYSRNILSLHDEALSAISSGNVSGSVKVGVIQDFSDAILRGLLADFTAQHPEVQIYVKEARTTQLKKLIVEGHIDIAIGMTEVDNEEAIKTSPLRWFGHAGLLDQEVLPLALYEAPCRFRDSILGALDAAERPYRIAVEAPNLAALRAAVEAGIGVTARTSLFGEEMTPPRGRRLPKLPSVGLIIYDADSLSPAAQYLSALAAEALLQV